MEDAELVRGGEAVGDLDSGGERELQAGRALGDHLVQRLAGDVLHDDVGLVLPARLGGRLADVVDGGDVGVVDGRGQAGLAQLRGADLLQRERAALEQLEDDRALQQRVGGQIDDTRSARADLALDLVVADCAALHALIIARLQRSPQAMLSIHPYWVSYRVLTTFTWSTAEAMRLNPVPFPPRLTETPSTITWLPLDWLVWVDSQAVTIVTSVLPARDLLALRTGIVPRPDFLMLPEVVTTPV